MTNNLTLQDIDSLKRELGRIDEELQLRPQLIRRRSKIIKVLKMYAEIYPAETPEPNAADRD